MSQHAVRKTYFSTSDLASLVGRLGEFTVDITKTTLVMFDGTTMGGIPLARFDHTHPDATDTASGFESASDHIYLYNHRHPNVTTLVDGFMSASDKAKLDGIPPGGGGGGGGGGPQSSANIPNTLVLRDTSGNFSSNFITAVKFIGPLNGNADTATNGIVSTGSYADPSWITTLNGAKIIGSISGSVISGLPWSKLTGSAPPISTFPDDAGYINGSGNTTGTSGGVLSTGGRETASPTPQTVVFRDSNGRSQVASPVANGDIANKAYVDASAGGSYSIASRVLAGGGFLASPSFNDITGSPGSLVSLHTYTVTFDRTQTFNETGVLHGLWLDRQNAIGVSSVPVVIEITTDTHSVAQFQMSEFFNTFTTATNQTTLWVELDLAYKTQLKIRMYTGTIGSPAGETFTFNTGSDYHQFAMIWRYTLNT